MTARWISPISASVMFFVLLFIVACDSRTDSSISGEETQKQEELAQIIETLKVENLLRDSLALAPDVEVILSYIEVPLGAELPLHYHPGEEFLYMLEGSGYLFLGDESITLKEGDHFKIPYKAPHSFATKNDQGRAVVFRVHEKGQPDRFLIEE